MLFIAQNLPRRAVRFMALRSPYSAMLMAGGLVLAMLTGCASGPSVDGSRGASAPRPPVLVAPSRPGADGPPERPPADLALVPDAEPQIEPIRQGGPNKPYVVLGQGYEPLADDVPFTQRGQASWYGTKFHGRRTASGEVYSMYGMTAAHRTLPIPSYARVRHVKSGKEIIVRINDRGPFHSSRVIDLSYTAAAKLDVLGHGVAEVEIERLTFEQIRTGQLRSGVSAQAQAAPVGGGPEAVVSPLPDPIFELAARLEEARPVSSPVSEPGGADTPTSVTSPPPTPTRETVARAYTPGAKGFWVQLAAFRQRQSVDQFQQRVAQELSTLAPLLAVYSDGALFRLQVGPYARHEAQSVAQRVRDALQLVPMVIERR
ncbi:MAG TPA: septal ring lytic transglycosylase RlpA family protein [Aquabacterium sp.]|nr:septal ring lytic transglycosylase RlpA family protein [Aquabacterium sp.]